MMIHFWLYRGSSDAVKVENIRSDSTEPKYKLNKVEVYGRKDK